MRFVEVADLGAYLHRELDEGDALANLACDGATAVVAEYIDMDIEHATVTVKLDGDGVSDALMLPVYPVFAIESIKFNAGAEDEEVLDPDEDYELGDAGIIYRLSNSVSYAWPSGRRNISVEYVSGYLDPDDVQDELDLTPAPDLPKTISLVALQVAARIYEVGMVESESPGGYSANYVKGAGTLTDYEKDILAHHRLVV